MSNKMVIHFEKFKMTQVNAINRHNLRLNHNYSNENIDLSRSDDNLQIKKQENLYCYINKEIENRVTGRVTKNSVVLIEGIISAGHTYLDGLSKQERDSYFKTAYDYLCERFGEKNVCYAVTHEDESMDGCKHMHIGILPITEDGRLCAKEIMNRGTLIDIQKEMPAYMQAHNFMISRGEEQSTATHLAVAKYKNEAERKKKTIMEKMKELINKYNLLVEKYNHLAKVHDKLQEENIDLAYDIVNDVEKSRDYFER